MYKNEKSEVHKGHRKRVKDNFIKNGLDVFSDVQALEMALFFCLPQGDTNELAHKLINKFGSFSAVFDATPEQLESVSGIGENTKVFLKYIPALLRRYRIDKIADDNIFETQEKTGRYLMAYFMTEIREKALVMAFDRKRRLLGTVPLPTSSVGTSAANAREIAELALSMKSDAIVIAHNHSSGLCEPSEADISATNALDFSLSTVGINLIEHYIVTNDSYLGIKEYIRKNGYMNT